MNFCGTNEPRKRGGGKASPHEDQVGTTHSNAAMKLSAMDLISRSWNCPTSHRLWATWSVTIALPRIQFITEAKHPLAILNPENPEKMGKRNVFLQEFFFHRSGNDHLFVETSQ